MIELIYSRDGIEDLRLFKTEEELLEWFEREKILCPNVKIIKKTKL